MPRNVCVQNISSWFEDRFVKKALKLQIKKVFETAEFWLSGPNSGIE